MKKLEYMTPEMEIVEMDAEVALLSGSDVDSEGNADIPVEDD